MNQRTYILFVNKIIDILHSAEIDAFLSLFLPNAELILPNTYCVGKDAIYEAVKGLYHTYEHISIEVERVLAQDDVVLVQWHWQDRNRFTGESHATETALVLELEGMQIKRWREYHAAVLGASSGLLEP